MVELVAVILAGAVIAAYFERKSLKADVAAAEAKVLTVAEKLIAELQLKEKSVRAKVSADVAKVIAAAKADAAKIIAEINQDAIVDTITKIRNLSANLEADLKKIL